MICWQVSLSISMNVLCGRKSLAQLKGDGGSGPLYSAVHSRKSEVSLGGIYRAGHPGHLERLIRLYCSCVHIYIQALADVETFVHKGTYRYIYIGVSCT